MRKEMYDLGIQLGMNKKDINDILKDTSMGDERTSFSMGPGRYGSAFYGTISINDFEE